MSSNDQSGASKVEIKFKQGNPLSDTTYPGLNHHVTVENSMRIERDIPVPMRDGTVLRIDVFRPDGVKENLPTIMSWNPYGKHGEVPWSTPLFQQFNLGFDTSKLSKYTAFEFPDPEWWCAHGYAVVFADQRGVWGSEGDATYWTQQEALDGHDTIEWLAAQSWSNGKVGLAGCSNLAWTQWYIAASRPPHLAAINPWEGVSDFYREFVFHGGIPETNFSVGVWHHNASFSDGLVEDIPTMAADHPLLDEYWESKGATLEDIEVPAFVVASWSDHGLHTRGSLEGFKKISSNQKWLLVHGGKKWAAQYADENLQRQLAFFDKFVKGVQTTDVDDWPPVVIEVRDSLKDGGTFRTENEWPLKRTQFQQLHLGPTGNLLPEPSPEGQTVSYDSADGSAVFDLEFSHDTEITGNMALKLWFEAPDSDDADLFVAIEKLDASGAEVPFHYYSVQEDGHVALGWLRASHRELDLSRSTPEQPVHTHSNLQPLPAGEPTLLDIEILASSTRFSAGETLRVLIQGRDVNTYPPMTPTLAHNDSVNKGRHVIHVGEDHDSYLLVPVVPS
ncbi:CocE/NonD family hydrolase [Williamsia soli]|uniref:CocE/NonD family hydrolase n=1 Tax=Williamsia soli TaxID=364929 RepID=UPI001A9F3866|nr:CocE/NonD family hydrolase [Williamsia soli]